MYWLIIPYLFAVVVAPAILALFRHDLAFASLLEWRNHVYILLACVVPATLGMVTLWLLPIRQAWLGISLGLIVAIGGIALWLKLRVAFVGGFESNAGAVATAITLLLPSCLMGAYAGYLRSQREN